MKEKKMLNTKSKKGFTLIEIMLVIVIIGIIAGIAVTKLVNSTGKAASTTAHMSLKGIEGAIQAYEMEHLRLPNSLDDLTKSDGGYGPYLKASELMDPWGQKFKYTKGGSHGFGYDLSTKNPDTGEEYNNWE
jgi:general secretion pathway protein G